MAMALKLKSLATTNLAVLCLRLVQFFFAGMEVGLMGYFIKNQLAEDKDPSSPYVFVLVVGVFTMITQFVYCFAFYHSYVWLWDVAVGTGWIISFFWLLNAANPIPCDWSAFNPFGSSHCGQVRAVLVIQIVLACLWYLTAACGLWTLFKNKKKLRAMGGEV